jgi:hypothetical protein
MEIGDQGQIETMPRMEGNPVAARTEKGVSVAKPAGQSASSAQRSGGVIISPPNLGRRN